jgi:hypothetical protein
MAYEQTPNFISIFKNNYKNGDKQPDMKGDGQIEFTCPHCNQTSILSMAIGAWKKLTKNNDTYLRLKVGPKMTRDDYQPKKEDQISDNIPF